MPNINTLKESRFLKKEDCPIPQLVTIKGCEQMNVAAAGQQEELKWCLTFQELEKPMVLNSTNGQIIAAICGSEETDDWLGHKIVLFNDPNVSYAGKIMGGIRARAPRAATPAAPVARPGGQPARMPASKMASIPPPEDEPMDDVPF